FRNRVSGRNGIGIYFDFVIAAGKSFQAKFAVRTGVSAYLPGLVGDVNLNSEDAAATIAADRARKPGQGQAHSKVNLFVDFRLHAGCSGKKEWLRRMEYRLQAVRSVGNAGEPVVAVAASASPPRVIEDYCHVGQRRRPGAVLPGGAVIGKDHAADEAAPSGNDEIWRAADFTAQRNLEQGMVPSTAIADQGDGRIKFNYPLELQRIRECRNGRPVLALQQLVPVIEESEIEALPGVRPGQVA